MDPRIKKYLSDDKIFNKINKQFISLERKDVIEINTHLTKVFDGLIKIMKNQDPLFKKTFRRTVWTGSFYKKTKVGSPDEFDLNLVIDLPIEENIQFSTNIPGYMKIRPNFCRNDTLKMDQKAYRDMMVFIDDQGYLNQDKFRRWIESVLSTAAHITYQNNKIKLDDYIITIRKSGPAFTLSLEIPNPKRTISIDLVPVLAFSSRRYPPPCRRNYLPEYCDRDWFLVPKPLNNENISGKEQNRYWRLSFYEFEKDILSEHGKVKPIIRHLKKFRDTQNWKCIASYYIETLCFHHLHIFKEQKKSSTFLFFTMLKQFYDAFCEHRIEYYWDEQVNLLEKVKYDEMINMKGRLLHIIKNIEKWIIRKPDDPFAIATYILNSNENKCLKYGVLNSESEAEPESEAESQWRCIIV